MKQCVFRVINKKTSISFCTETFIFATKKSLSWQQVERCKGKNNNIPLNYGVKLKRNNVVAMKR